MQPVPACAAGLLVETFQRLGQIHVRYKPDICTAQNFSVTCLQAACGRQRAHGAHGVQGKSSHPSRYSQSIQCTCYFCCGQDK